VAFTHLAFYRGPVIFMLHVVGSIQVMVNCQQCGSPGAGRRVKLCQQGFRLRLSRTDFIVGGNGTMLEQSLCSCLKLGHNPHNHWIHFGRPTRPLLLRTSPSLTIANRITAQNLLKLGVLAIESARVSAGTGVAA
jgi:hypothetical protein